MSRLRPLCLFLAFLAHAPALSATVFEKLSDRQLVDRSDAVVTAIVRDAVARETANGMIVTDYHLIVEEVLRGSVADTLTITEFGGTIGTRVVFIADSASYSPGERVMAFLKRRGDGTYFTTSMALGKFTFSKTARGQSVLVRQAEELRDEPARLEDGFKQFVRGASVPYRSATATSRLRVTPNGNAKNYALTASGFPVRWFNATVTFVVNGNPVGNSLSNGLGAWTGDPASNINLINGGTTNLTAPNQNDHINVVLMDYSGSVGLAGLCDGSSACTVGAGNVTSSFDGDTWVVIDDADVMIRPGLALSQADALMTHEFGHAIGIRHSDQGSPSDSAAIMASTIPATFGSNLQQWDKDAVDSLYGNGPVCRPPTITAVIGGGTVTSGLTATLSVTASGTGTFTYQWYDGNPPDVSTPVGGNSASFTTPPIATQKTYWVRVTNTCGSADSTAVTVTPFVCQKPVITINPQSQTIASGASANLTVGHTGSGPFTYQWYRGQAPDTSDQIMFATASQFATGPLTQSTSFWVHVQNSCGAADSSTAKITIIGACENPTFTLQPTAGVIKPGKPTYLIAGASNATSYQWYKGTAPDTSTPANGLTPSDARWLLRFTSIFLDAFPTPLAHRP